MSLRLLSTSALLVLAATILLPGQDLSLTSSGYEEAIVGQPFSYTIIAASTTAATFSASGLPIWLTCNATTGVISGTPTAIGTVLVTITASDGSGSVAKMVRIDINADSPVVIADPGTLVAQAGEVFNVQVLASGSPTAYSAVGLPPGLTITGATGFISGVPTAGASYPVSLIATSAQGTWVTSLNMNVYPYLPVIDNRTITTTVGNAVRADIGGSNVPTSWSATNLPQGLNLDSTSGIITGVTTTVGSSTCSVTASNAGGTGSATWTIVVNPAGVGGLSLTTPFPVATIGSVYNAQATASGTPTGYAATGLPSPLAIDPTSGAISGTPASGSAGSYPLLITATYASGTVSTATTLTINPPLPVITSPPTILVGLNLAFTDGVEASNSPTAFSATGLPTGLTIDPSLGIISGPATALGTYPATISVTNAGGTATAAVTFVVSSVPTPTTAPGIPVIGNAATLTALVGVPVSAGILATNAPTSYGVTGLPTNLTFSTSTGIISGSVTTAGIYPITVSATNGSGTGTAVVTLIAYAVPVTAIESSLANQYAILGSTFSYQLYATYGPTTYAMTDQPPGLTINATTGLISGIPTSVGSYTATITATNSSGTVVDLLTIIVTASPALPTFTYNADLVATVGAGCNFMPRNPVGVTTFSAPGLTGIPGNLVINGTSGAITGAATTPGSYPITVSGANASGTTTVSTTILVNAVGGPGITSALTTINVAVGAPLSYTITSATTGATFAAANLPPNTMVDPATGIILGSPTSGGTFVVIISASLGGVTTSEPLTIVVTPAPPVITTTALAPARVGEAYYTTIDATNAPTGYAATGLPPGVIVDPVYGTLSGLPTTGGSYAVQVTATNAGGSGSATVAVVVNAPNAPTITSPATIYTVPNASFAYQITALNDPLTFSATGLPSGVNISSTGLISGATTTLGTVQVLITATNALASRTSVLDIVTVAPGSPGAPPPPAASSGGGSSSHCGHGFAFGMLFLLMLCAWHRRGLAPGRCREQGSLLR